jgi:hypothetical protein
MKYEFTFFITCILCLGSASFAGGPDPMHIDEVRLGKRSLESVDSNDIRNIRHHQMVPAGISECAEESRKRSFGDAEDAFRRKRHHAEKDNTHPDLENFLEVFRGMRLGKPDDLYAMGILQLEGKGHLNPSVAKEAALNLFKKATQQGHQKSQQIYTLLERSLQGSSDANYQLGLMYLRGDVIYDDQKARREAITLFQKAVGQGHAGALQEIKMLSPCIEKVRARVQCTLKGGIDLDLILDPSTMSMEAAYRAHENAMQMIAGPIQGQDLQEWEREMNQAMKILNDNCVFRGRLNLSHVG